MGHDRLPCSKQTSLVLEAIVAPSDGKTPRAMAHSHSSNGEDYEESSVTRGLDFLKPYKSASNSWRMDVKA